MRAYLDRLAVWPGETIRVHASDVPMATVAVRELIHSDPDLNGPGVIDYDCEWGRGNLTAPLVAASIGSYGICEDALVTEAGFTISLWIWPTDLTRDVTLFSWQSGDRCGLEIIDGHLLLRGAGQNTALDYRLRERTWNFVGVSHGDATGIRTSGTTIFASVWGRTGGPFCQDVFAPEVVPKSSTLWVGTADGMSGELDGRVAGLRVHNRPLDVVDLMNVMNGVGDPADLEWNFDDRSDPDVVHSNRSDAALRLHHGPTWLEAAPAALESSGRPITGPGSVHFHRDDTEDCSWPEVLTVTVPSDARPGIYSLDLRGSDGLYELPFVVKAKSDVLLLIPTLTWQAYANLGRDANSWPGLSHYSLHSDGSPVVVTTSLKPTQTFASTARLEVDEGDGFAKGRNATHLLMADLYAWYWLKQEFPDQVGVADDRELHFDGDALLNDVKVLLLSAHPEYWTAAMLDALNRFIVRGGNVVYLGGNGLYWVTSLHASKPHLMEIRRWGGSQTWSVEEDETRHQFESLSGGLWAESGLPPNVSVGIGFAGFGTGPSLEYVRTPASYTPDWSWLFDGVRAESVGAGGLNTGAGNEFDHFDLELPGPGESVIVATASPASPDHFGVFELGGQRAPTPGVQGDMVITTTAAGGLVFSVGSITASGCLSSRKSGDFQQLMRNVVVRMLGNA